MNGPLVPAPLCFCQNSSSSNVGHAWESTCYCMYQSYKMSGNQSRAKTCIRRTELIVNGILFGIWNNLTTIINAKTLVDEGHSWGAALTLFFLFFPGKNKTWFVLPLVHLSIHSSIKFVLYISTSVCVLCTPNAS